MTNQWIQTLAILISVVMGFLALRSCIKKSIKEQYAEIIKKQTKIHDANSFMMKMLFEIIDILDGKKINGQVKKLRKEAEQFNIDN